MARWTIRPYDAVTDAAAVQRLDTAYTSCERYEVHGDGARLVLAPVACAPTARSYAIDLAADDWQHARVARCDGELRGFIAWGVQAWNRRLAIWHFYVDRRSRGQGAGRLLITAALAWAAQHALRVAWVETSSVNQPAIAAYRRLGFALCGFDTTLYEGDDELAIYLARPITAADGAQSFASRSVADGHSVDDSTPGSAEPSTAADKPAK